MAVVNPRPVRRFAEARGHLAKTDPHAAAVLAPFAEAVRPQPDTLTQALRMLLAELSERSRLGPRQRATRVGRASFNRACGRTQGRRHRFGGRAAVRAAWYQAARVARGWNAPWARFYHGRVARGQAPKGARVAGARRRLTICKAKLRSPCPWDEKRVVPPGLPGQSLPPLR